MQWSLSGENLCWSLLGLKEFWKKTQTSFLINLLILHTGTTTGSAKGSKFFPDLSAARQKAQRRWATMYVLTEWEGRTGKYLAWQVQSLNQKTLLKRCLWQITSSSIPWCSPQILGLKKGQGFAYSGKCSWRIQLVFRLSTHVNNTGLSHFKLGRTKNKSSKWSEWDFNPGQPDCKSKAVTTRPPCLLISLGDKH